MNQTDEARAKALKERAFFLEIDARFKEFAEELGVPWPLPWPRPDEADIKAYADEARKKEEGRFKIPFDHPLMAKLEKTMLW